MATGSTASSGTDPQDPPEPGEPADAPTPGESGADEAVHDPGRRAFFFQFGKQAASAVGQVAGLADVVGRTSSALAGELLGLDEPEASPGKSAFVRSGRSAEPVTSAAAPAAEHTYRSAYRLTDEGLVILDQRRIPEALDEVEAGGVAKRQIGSLSATLTLSLYPSFRALPRMRSLSPRL